MGRDLARRLRNGRLSRPRSGDEANSEIVEFLFGDEDEVIRGAFRVIMFADLVASTAITQRVGDDAAQRVVDAHDAAVAEALSAHHGVQIKHTGDGAMAAFDSATNALRAAHELANRFRAIGVNARVGLNAGEPIERNGDLFGTAVQLAARVCDAASKGEVLATQAVRDIAAGKQLSWSPPRELHLKGFDQPVKVSSLVLD